MSTSLALDTLNDFTLDEISATKKFIRMLLTNLAQKYDGLRVDDMNEDTFVKSLVDPIMGAFFKNEDDNIIDGCSTTLANSETSRKKFDPSLRGKIADITVLLKDENQTKEKDDVNLLKLANMMKNSIDYMHNKGLTFDWLMQPLCDGFWTTIFFLQVIQAGHFFTFPWTDMTLGGRLPRFD
ncbi:hypothetical protein BC941DRAFT_477538 [Chlamydoabsidia padenii]|nr:hypothetical protein BC941DRAFT_477538 [Chlamydoabsidia padenii]